MGLGSSRAGEPLLSERLMAVLKHEMKRLESNYEDSGPIASAAVSALKPEAGEGTASDDGGSSLSGKTAPADGPVKPPRLAKGRKAAPTRTKAEPSGADLKGRVEAIGQMTRTLEKLLELQRLEALAARSAGEADAAETERLREELMRRLRAIDARREGGPRLFDAKGALGGGEAGERSEPPAQGLIPSAPSSTGSGAQTPQGEAGLCVGASLQSPPSSI